jgi:hypothetical protein
MIRLRWHDDCQSLVVVRVISVDAQDAVAAIVEIVGFVGSYIAALVATIDLNIASTTPP